MSRLTAIPYDAALGEIERRRIALFLFHASKMIGQKPTISDPPVDRRGGGGGMRKTFAIDPVTRIEGHAKVFII